MSGPHKGPGCEENRLQTGGKANAHFAGSWERWGGKVLDDVSRSQHLWLARQESASCLKDENHPMMHPPAPASEAQATNVTDATAPAPRHPGDVPPQLCVGLGSIRLEQFGYVELNVLSFSPQINSFYVNIGISSPHEGERRQMALAHLISTN